MGSSRQLGLGPMAVQEVASGLATPSKKVGATPLVDLAFRAFARCGMNAQQAAAALGMTPPNFSKAFSVNWPENNPVMKKWDSLPDDVRREFVVLQAADWALGQPDAEQTRILRDFARVLKEIA